MSSERLCALCNRLISLCTVQRNPLKGWSAALAAHGVGHIHTPEFTAVHEDNNVRCLQMSSNSAWTAKKTIDYCKNICCVFAQITVLQQVL